VNAPTEDIDRAIRWAADDLQAARAAHQLRPGCHTADNVRAYEDALNGLLERRKEYR
jgi:hypothetical protein